ncbi:DUF2207 domain-containing protein [Streptococcus dysgalactiae]|uniref:DUF2207 domain-containing protein n=1 Tax=Streptococcus dysgalactiae TaxID=1334 RepID=UPI001C4ABE41|nr:DUF2207 domain-containing protein [Streptococcus dysgalactiae]
MKKILMMFVLCFSFLGMRVTAADVDYSITNYEGLLVLSKENTARFEQKVTYQFDTSYNGQYISLGRAGNLPDGFAIDQNPKVEVYHNGQQVPVNQEFSDLGDGYRLKLYNAGQAGDKVDVKVIWQLHHLLTAYQDVAELNWTPISDWDKTLEKVSLTVTTPADIQDSGLWAHRGYYQKDPQVFKKGSGGYQINAQNVSGRLELHAYWDRKALLGAKPVDVATSKKNKIVALETKISRRRALLQLLFGKIIPLVEIGFLLWQLIQFKRLKKQFNRYHLANHTDHSYEVPEDLSPLVLTQHLYKQSLTDLSPTTPEAQRFWGPKGVTFEALVQATLLDLIDRKVLLLSKEEGKAYLEISQLDWVTDEEAYFLEMAFGNNMTLPVDQLFSQYHYDADTIKQLKKTYKGKKLEQEVRQSSEQVIKAMKKASAAITSSVLETIKKLGLSDSYRQMTSSEKRKSHSVQGLGCLLVVLNSSLLIYLTMKGSGLALIYLALLGLATCLSFYINLQLSPYRKLGIETPEGAVRLHQWQSFKNMMRDINKFDDVPIDGLVVWNRILIYATLFGYAKQIERYLKVHRIALPEVYQDIRPGELSTIMYATTPTFVSSLSSATTSSNFSVSSGSGVSGGGGFSGGGGGGGGGAF